MKQEQLKIDQPLVLEKGGILPELELTYHTDGMVTGSRKPVIWVVHALTANSNVYDWWPEVFGRNAAFNPDDFQIICVNNLGSCYGTTGPLSKNPENGTYYHRFPEFTIRDMAYVLEWVRHYLGIETIDLLVGASMGGQIALEWAWQKPGVVKRLVPIATNAFHSPWGVAFNEAQRMAIEADPSWREKKPDAGLNGMKAARATALLSYRSYKAFATTQSEGGDGPVGDFRAATYQRYQGEKLAMRFNAFSYWYLSKAMDSHHLGRNRKSVEQILQDITSDTLVLSLKDDQLFPESEQRFLAEHIPDARHKVIPTVYGHDGFLIEGKKIGQAMLDFFEETEKTKKVVSDAEA